MFVHTFSSSNRNMKVEEYEKEALQDLSMDKVDTESFRNYVISLGFKRIKWGRYLYDEECITSLMEDKLKELYRKKFHYYTYEYEVKIDKKNIDIYVHGDEEYRAADKMYKKQQNKEKLVAQVLDAIDKQSFTANTVLKHLIWESGGSKIS